MGQDAGFLWEVTLTEPDRAAGGTWVVAAHAAQAVERAWQLLARTPSPLPTKIPAGAWFTPPPVGSKVTIERLGSTLTWSCMVCGDERPDARISVTQRQSIEALTWNVRHCNDRTDCVREATDPAPWRPRMADTQPDGRLAGVAGGSLILRQPDYVVFRAGPGVDPADLAGDEGRWYDRTDAARIVSPGQANALRWTATPTGRYEVRHDGAVAEVLEVVPTRGGPAVSPVRPPEAVT